MRSFKIVLLNKEHLDKKKQEKYSIQVKDDDTPKIAAKKLFEKYLSPKNEFYIKETTNESKKKIWGPYLF